MDADFRALISDCWHAEPSLRPSFSVILIRLQNIGADKSARVKSGLSEHAQEVVDSGVKELSRDVNTLLWDYAPAQWDQAKADLLISNDATITARDPTLKNVLSSEKGPSSAKALGWIMFGGVEDGAEIRQEPILDSDIVVNHNESYVLLKSRFSLIGAAKIKQWRVKDTREFDGLQAALAASEESIESWGMGALHKETDAARTAGVSGTKKKRRVRLKRKKPAKKTKKDSRLENFIKAARFVRGYGAAAIHPSAKVELYGLRMQAQKGDCKDQSGVGAAAAAAESKEESSVTSLQRLKLEAWRSVRGKSQEAAMEEYLALLASLAPNWKAAHLVLGRQSAEKRRKPREMMWVLKIRYRQRSEEEMVSTAASRLQREKGMAYKPTRFQVTSIEILQSSNEANAKLWSEDEATMEKVPDGNGDAESPTPSEMHAFLAKLPKDLALSDCIIDKSAHATIEEQRAYFCEEMRMMARVGHDEEDGWEYFGKTIEAGVSEDEQLDVYSRSVKWSASSQLRTRAETEYGVEDVFEWLVQKFGGRIEHEVDVSIGAAKSLSRAASSRIGYYPFLTTAEDGCSVTALYYQETEFPWCVTKSSPPPPPDPLSISL